MANTDSAAAGGQFVLSPPGSGLGQAAQWVGFVALRRIFSAMFHFHTHFTHSGLYTPFVSGSANTIIS